jgi:hypothetical protein
VNEDDLFIINAKCERCGQQQPGALAVFLDCSASSPRVYAVCKSIMSCEERGILACCRCRAECAHLANKDRAAGSPTGVGAAVKAVLHPEPEET